MKPVCAPWQRLTFQVEGRRGRNSYHAVPAFRRSFLSARCYLVGEGQRAQPYPSQLRARNQPANNGAVGDMNGLTTVTPRQVNPW